MIFVTPPALPPVNLNARHTVIGRVQAIVLDRYKRPVWRGPVQKNLILNNGLDRWCDLTIFGNLALYCVAGTGSTDTSANPTPTVAVQAGTTVTLAGGTFVFTNTATDAGKMLHWNDGHEARIVTVTAPTIIEVTPSQIVASGAFLVYNTNQVGLVTEVKRTNTYLAGAGNTETTYPGVTMQNRRTYDFSPEVGGITYNELGISWVVTPGNNLFSRVKLATGVSMVAGQSLRVIWDLITSFSPICTAPAAITPSPITGWAGATGDAAICQPSGLSDINGGYAVTSLEPSVSGTSVLYNWTAFAWPSWPGNPAGTPHMRGQSGAHALSVYTPLSFYRDQSYTYLIGEGNGVDINVISNARWGLSNPSFVYLIGSNQTKDSLHTLAITFRYSVGRTLA
jgi:hypothetical protein